MNHKDRERIAIVETKVTTIDKKVEVVSRDVKKILVNHLPHIRKELAVNKVKIGVIVGGVAIVVSTVITIVITKLLDKL